MPDIVSSQFLKPASFGSFALQAPPYRTLFLEDALAEATPDVRAILSSVAHQFPVDVGRQPRERLLTLHVQISCPSSITPQTAFGYVESLHKAFDVLAANPAYLVVLSPTGSRRLACRPERIIPMQGLPSIYIIQLMSAEALWESDEKTDIQTITTSPLTWTVENKGTARCFPTFEVKPTVIKDHDDDYIHRRQVIIASRTEQEMVSTDGVGYPIEINEDTIDLSAENVAGRLLANGNDLRVLVDGVEVNRWIDTTLALDYIWANISFKPMRRLLLKDNMTAAVPANGAWVEVSDPEGTLGWDNDGYFIIDDECCHYTDRDGTRLQLSNINGRGARNTTAAIHVGGTDYLYWVEHEIQIVSDYTAAGSPPASTDRQPVIDLANSTNLIHKYPGAVFVAPTTLRSAQLLRRYTNDNLLSPAISLLEEAGGIKFRDIAPTAAAPQFNNLELYVPCGIKAAAGAIAHDIAIQDMLSLWVLGIDMEGLETLLEVYHTDNDGAAVTITPVNVLSRLRYNAVSLIATGVRATDDDDFLLSKGADYEQAQGFVLDQPTEIEMLLVRLKKSGNDINPVVQLWDEDAGGGPGNAISSSLAVADPAVIGVYEDIPLFFDETIIQKRRQILPAGTYFVAVLNAGAPVDDLYWSATLQDVVRTYARENVWIRAAPAAWTIRHQTARFAVGAIVPGLRQTDAPAGSIDEISLDDIEVTFDNTTPRTPKIVVSPQEDIYWLKGVIRNDDTGQELTLNFVCPLNTILTIDCENHTVVRSDTGESVPGLVTPSDLDEWMRFDPGMVHLRYT